MGIARRKHSARFKVKAVRLITEKGISLSQAARDLGIARSLLTRWKRDLVDRGAAGFPASRRRIPLEEVVARLRRENDALRRERDILRRAARPPKV